MRISRTCTTAIAIEPALATALLLLSACSEPRPDPARLVLGHKVYEQHCAVCHGVKLEGQPGWQKKLPNGRFPAPPHDDSGHTWHHPMEVLFGITKLGLVPPYAPAGYESDMPAFAGKLSDEEIRAVLAYIEWHWSDEVKRLRAQMLRNVRQR
jgi:mono/diheme cytochrome c family protein